MTSASLKKCKYFVLLQHLNEILLLTVRKVFINKKKRQENTFHLVLRIKEIKDSMFGKQILLRFY